MGYNDNVFPDFRKRRSLVELVVLENPIKHKLKEKQKLLDIAISDLAVYGQYQGVPSLMVRAFSVDDLTNPPSIGRIQGSILPFECYLLDKVFSDFMDRAQVEILFRNNGERFPPEKRVPRVDFNHLYTSPAFVSAGTNDYIRFRRYRFTGDAFSGEIRDRLIEKVEAAFLNFSVAVDPLYRGEVQPIDIYCNRLLEIRFKLSPDPFGYYALNEGTVIGKKPHTTHNLLLTEVRGLDGKIELIDPVGIWPICVGQVIKYHKFAHYSPMSEPHSRNVISIEDPNSPSR